MIDMVKIGEETGDIPGALQSLAETYEEDLQGALRVMTSMIEPMLIIVMGLVFEMPLLAWLLSALGILRKGMLREYKKHAVVALLVLAAIITPSGDPFTLMVVFVPLYMLYEISIWVVKEDDKDEDGEGEDEG